MLITCASCMGLQLNDKITGQASRGENWHYSWWNIMLRPWLPVAKTGNVFFWNDGLVSVLGHIHKSPCTFTIGQFSAPTVPRIIAKERKNFWVGSFCLACKRLRPWGFVCFGILANPLLNDPAGWNASSGSETPLYKVLWILSILSLNFPSGFPCLFLEHLQDSQSIATLGVGMDKWSFPQLLRAELSKLLI